MNSINLMDVVPGTVTNAEGLTLFVLLEEFFKDSNKITISLEGASPMSSSFMNSSFGALVEKYGLDEFRNVVSFTRYTKSHARSIKRYFAFYKDVVQK